MNDKLRWGILGAGRIAGVFARALATSATGELYAVGSRTRESADRFGDEFNVPVRHGSYEALLADPAVQAVYIATLHPWHAEWAIKAADAGKHILCEKPLTINTPEALAVIEAARRNDVFLMEAFMYRCHPQTQKLAELLKAKAIGDVRAIQATFSFQGNFDQEARHLKNAKGGGGIMDLGCYCMSMARLIAGADAGKDFAEPVELKAVGHIGEISKSDEWTVAAVKFPGDIVAQLACAVMANQGENAVRIFGDGGSIYVPTPWFPARDGGAASLFIHRNGEEKPEEIVIREERGLYTIEADTVAENITRRQAPSPAMSWDDTLGNMRALDRWRREVGMVFESELPAAWTLPVDKKPPAVRPEAKMPHGTIDGVTKPVSRLVIGAMAAETIAHACVLYDAFVEYGGTAFDTAYVYGGGEADRLLGQWMKLRGNREQVVVLAKGAHTPFCNPVDLTRQFFETLERMQADYVDIYAMHRDNPAIPAGEFIDVVNEHMRAGRIRAFAVSNWSLARVEEANAYAKAKGLRGISTVSNNFSLARMIEAPWNGCVSASDPASREWFLRTRLPLMSWSSQAQGFFALGDSPEWPSLWMARCWSSDDNYQRLARAKELAQKYGVSPLNIALAYVLNQPFPTFALVGPQTPTEVRTLMPALDITLSEEEMRWLNLEIS
jgi:predicted dehydrogenase/aryl-alcohol dehydrogenase-like predicted oxidoreductase